MGHDLTSQNKWPDLKFDAYQDTLLTLHLWSQIVGKIRLKKSPWLNHSWHVTLYVSTRGLTTGSIPFENGIFQIDFDFLNHQLEITSSQNKNVKIDLYPRTVSSFYKELVEKLAAMEIEVVIHTSPNEVDPAIPFEKDEVHKSYDKEQIFKMWQALIKAHNVFTQFRAGFSGKCSPVHLFWGAFDLAVTRFSGRPAPLHSGGMPNIPLEVMQEAYSQEVSSCGFWLGSKDFPQPSFYAYCYPTPPAFGKQPVEPKEAFFSEEMGEFFLTYDALLKKENPEEILLKFLETTYQAAASTGNWNSAAMEFNFEPLQKKVKK